MNSIPVVARGQKSCVCPAVAGSSCVNTRRPAYSYRCCQTSEWFPAGAVMDGAALGTVLSGLLEDTCSPPLEAKLKSGISGS